MPVDVLASVPYINRNSSVPTNVLIPKGTKPSAGDILTTELGTVTPGEISEHYRKLDAASTLQNIASNYDKQAENSVKLINITLHTQRRKPRKYILVLSPADFKTSKDVKDIHHISWD